MFLYKLLCLNIGSHNFFEISTKFHGKNLVKIGGNYKENRDCV